MLLGLFSPCLAATAETVFQQGVSAFRQQEYARARDAFEQALHRGLATPGLHYNLGVTYYRLGEYALAAQQFQRLTAIKKWRALAYYNLALVAEKRGSPEEALRRYGQVADGGDARLADLARRALLRLQGPALPHWVSVSLSYGHDDNVTLIPDAAVAGESDSLREGFVIGRRYFSPDWSLEGVAYGLRYDDFSQFDTTLMGAELHRQARRGEWRLDHALGAAGQWLDQEHCQTIFNLESRADRSLASGQTLLLQAELARIHADDPFGYLQGWRLRAQARWLQSSGAAQWQWGYRLEANERDDRAAGEDFSSFSPQRHRLRGAGQWPLTERLTLRGTVGYEFSHYDDLYRLDGEGRRRQDRRLTASARLDMDLMEHWRLFGKYTRTRNSSTLDFYDYQRNEVVVGLEYTSL